MVLLQERVIPYYNSIPIALAFVKGEGGAVGNNPKAPLSGKVSAHEVRVVHTCDTLRCCNKVLKLWAEWMWHLEEGT